MRAATSDLETPSFEFRATIFEFRTPSLKLRTATIAFKASSLKFKTTTIASITSASRLRSQTIEEVSSRVGIAHSITENKRSDLRGLMGFATFKATVHNSSPTGSDPMLKVLETTLDRLVIKEKRSTCDVAMIVVFLYVTVYFLLISILKMWTKLGVNESLLDSIYHSATHPPLVYLTGIGLLLFPAALVPMLTFGSWLPIRTFTFDRKTHLLTIRSTCLLAPQDSEYSLDEIQIQWVPQSVYAGGLTVVNIQLLQLVRRKQNGKIHLIPIRHTTHPETNTVVNLIHEFLISRS